MKPFIRWAGGKTWFLPRLRMMLPDKFRRFHEPFVGGGAVFLSLEHKRLSFISDINEELINTYIQVRDNLDLLLERLDSFVVDEDNYYLIRASSPENNVERAARFIFLNKTCFNGIYRVNLNGRFNVPFGKNNNATLYEYDHIKAISKKIQKSRFYVRDFEVAIRKAKPDDLVFLDPPYTVAHNHNGFVEYNQKIFKWEDQIRLKNCILWMEENDIKYIMTNAMHESIINLYKCKGKFYEVERQSTIGGKPNSRQKISEIVLTNCM